jgi:transcriptional regulator with XRE-family HTH domain
MQSQDMARDLGRAIRDARRRREMTQEGLALESGLQRKTVHQIETGKTHARIDTLHRIASAIGVPVTSLLARPGKG